MSSAQTQLAAQLRILSGSSQSKAADPRFIAAKPSFLFDPKVAADTDNQTIHHIGLNGLAELRKDDERFAAFESTLFNAIPGSTLFDRGSQPVKSLAALDQSIANFMRVLSPHFLRKPAHKVIEYLIRRFSIQEHNTDAILECILPYHQTPLFARMLQLTKLDSPRWLFLQEAQKNGSVVLRETLVQRCLSDLSVLQFIGDSCKDVISVSRLPEHFKTSLTFFTVVAVETLTRSREVSESVILKLLPMTFEGLKNKKWFDCQLSSYMILSQLCHRTALAPVVLESVIINIIKNVSADATATNLSSALAAIVCIFQTQTISTIPAKALGYLVNFNNLVPAIGLIHADYDCSSFLSSLLQSLVTDFTSTSSYPKVLTQVVSQSSLSSHILPVISGLMQLYVSKKHGGDLDQSVEKTLLDLLFRLDTLYPKQMEQAIGTALQNSKKQQTEAEDTDDATQAKEYHSLLLDLISNSFKGTRHDYLSFSGTSIILSLEHPSIDVRLAALDKVEQMLMDKSMQSSQYIYLSSSILNRLHDDNSKIVNRVLRLHSLTSIVDIKTLSTELLSLLHDHTQLINSSFYLTNEQGSRQLSQSVSIVSSILEVMSHQLISSQPSLLSSIIPYFLHFLLLQQPTYKLNTRIIRFVSNINHSLFQGFDQVAAKLKTMDNTSNDKSYQVINSAIVQQLVRNINEDSSLQSVVESTYTSGLAKILIFHIFSSLVSVRTSSDIIFTDQQRLLSMIVTQWYNLSVEDRIQASKQVKPFDMSSYLPSTTTSTTLYANFLYGLHFHLAGFKSSLNLSLNDLLQPLSTSSFTCTTNEQHQLKYLRALYTVLASSTQLDQPLSVMLQTHLSDKLLAFLFPFLVSSADESYAVPLVVVVRSFQLAQAMVATSTSPLLDAASKKSNQSATATLERLVISGLVGCAHTNKSVRYVALLLLNTVQSHIDQYTSSFESSSLLSLSTLLYRLYSYREEVLTDYSFMGGFLSTQLYIDPSSTTTTVVGRQLSVNDKSLLHRYFYQSLHQYVLHPYVQHIFLSSLRSLSTLSVVDIAVELLNTMLQSHTSSIKLIPLHVYNMNILITCINDTTISQSNVYATLIACLSSSLHVVAGQQGHVTSFSVKRSASHQINDKLFQQLNSSQQIQLVGLLCSLLGSRSSGSISTDVTVVETAQVVMKRLVIPSSIFVNQLQVSSIQTAAKYSEEALSQSVVSILPILEVLQYKDIDTIVSPYVLVDSLFQLLSSMLKSHQHEVEYGKQLVLASLRQLFIHYSNSQAAGADTTDVKKQKKSAKQSNDVSITETQLSGVISCIVASSPKSTTEAKTEKNVDDMDEDDNNNRVNTADMIATVTVDPAVESTRNHALLLISAMSSLAPSLLASHLTPVFQHVLSLPSLHKDDSYSFSVLQQTMETVIPSIVSSSSQSVDISSFISSVLHTFISACPQLPAHRRIRLLYSLISTLSATHLHGAVAILLFKAVTSSVTQSKAQDAASYNENDKQQKKKKVVGILLPGVQQQDEKIDWLEMSHELVELFEFDGQVISLIQLLKFLSKFQQTSTKSSVGASNQTTKVLKSTSSSDIHESIVDYLPTNIVSSLNATNIYQLESKLLSFVSIHLTRSGFLSSLVDVSEDKSLSLQDLYLHLFEQLFHQLRSLTDRYNIISKSISTSTSTSSQSKLIEQIKSLQSICHTTLVNLNSLLFVDTFVSVVQQLLNHTDISIRRKALELLVEKVNQSMEVLVEEDMKHLITLLPILQSIVKQGITTLSVPEQDDDNNNNNNNKTDKRREVETSVQMSLMSMDVMSRALSSLIKRDSHLSSSVTSPLHQAFAAIFPTILQCVQVANPLVVGSSLICMASQITLLKAHVLPQLPSLMPALLSTLESTLRKGSDDEDSSDESEAVSTSAQPTGLLQTACLHCILSLVANLAAFLSPYIPRILDSLLHPSLLKQRKRGGAADDDDDDDDSDMDSDSEEEDDDEITKAKKAAILAKKQAEQTEVYGLLNDILSLMSVSVDVRLLLPHMFTAYEHATVYGDHALQRLFHFMGQICEHITLESIKVHFKTVFKFFLVAFDLRKQYSESLVNVDQVEDSLLDAFMQFVMKLNEGQLKGSFLKLLQWLGVSGVGATLGLNLSSLFPTEGQDGEEEPNNALKHQRDVLSRSVLFFKVVHRLAQRLKSLFVPYFGYLLEHCVMFLQAPSQHQLAVSSSKPKRKVDEDKKKRKRSSDDDETDYFTPDDDSQKVSVRSLWYQLNSLVCQSLEQCFKNDTKQLISSEQLDKLIVPLADQLEIGLKMSRDVSDYTSYMSTSVVPCLGQLSERLGNFTLWKPLHAAVLSRSRHEVATVRFASLKVLQDWFERLREGYLVMLPETLPFIAELMEDSNIEVERLCQEVIKQIEQLSGESLQQHLQA